MLDFCRGSPLSWALLLLVLLTRSPNIVSCGWPRPWPLLPLTRLAVMALPGTMSAITSIGAFLPAIEIERECMIE